MNLLHVFRSCVSVRFQPVYWPVPLLFAAVLFFCASNLSAQTFFPERADVQQQCGSPTLHRILQNTETMYRARQAAADRAYRQQENTRSSGAHPEGPAVVYTIPVVVHVMHLPGTPVGRDENISANQIRAGIQHLTEAFRKGHPDYDGIGHNKNIVGADVEFEFQLARRDPAGNPTDGIVRVPTAQSNLNLDKPSNDLALKNLSRWSTDRYLNIWLVKEVCYFSTGNCDISGYATAPGAHGQPFDGIVQEAVFFGSSRSDSKMHIHETGHYFNLLHTHEGGCTNNNCLTDGDQVCDTPPDNDVNGTLCGATNGVNSCTTDEQDASVQNPYRPVANGGLGDQNDHYENFMDTGNRSCQNGFTTGQKNRMVAALTLTRSSLITGNTALTPSTNAALAAFSDDGATINESSGLTVSDCRTYTDVSIPILLYNAPAAPVTIQITINSATGTATPGADFVLQTPVVNIAPGLTTANVLLRIFNDRTVENAETVVLTLSSATGNNGNTGIAPYNSQFVYLIFDNDVAPSGTPPVLFSTVFTNNSGTGLGVNALNPWIFGSFNAPPTTNVFRIANNGGTCTSGGSLYVTNNLATLPNAYDDIESSPIAYRTIDATGYSNLTVSYDMKVGGAAGLDRGRIYTRNLTAGATSFSLMSGYSNIANINCAVNNSIPLPATFNNAVFDFAFNFTTSAGNGNVPPSMTIDNFQVTAPATPVSVTDKETASAYLGPQSTVHFVSAAGRVLATLDNRSNHDYGCTTISVNRAGTSAVGNGGAYQYASKTFIVDPANDNTGATELFVTLYYTAAERNGWLAATNFPAETFYVARAPGEIAAATDATTVTRLTTTVGYGTDYAYTARFETGLSGTPGFSMASNSVLPVEWLYFKGEKVQKSVRLQWATASEYDTDHFIVEKSSEGTMFSPVGRVKGRNNGLQQESYELYDHSPRPGANYYRLTGVDRSGSTQRAPIVLVSFDEALSAVLQPNPLAAGSVVTLLCQSPVSGTFTSDWTDATGRLCKRTEMTLERGENRLEMSVHDLESGLYFVHLKDEKGMVLSVLKFVKM